MTKLKEILKFILYIFILVDCERISKKSHAFQMENEISDNKEMQPSRFLE